MAKSSIGFLDSIDKSVLTQAQSNGFYELNGRQLGHYFPNQLGGEANLVHHCAFETVMEQFAKDVGTGAFTQYNVTDGWRFEYYNLRGSAVQFPTLQLVVEGKMQSVKFDTMELSFDGSTVYARTMSHARLPITRQVGSTEIGKDIFAEDGVRAIDHLAQKMHWDMVYSITRQRLNDLYFQLGANGKRKFDSDVKKFYQVK